MKKIFLFLTIISLFSLMSCKKDYTCTCVNTYSDGSPSDTDVIMLTKVTKSEARANCIDVNSTNSNNPGVETKTECSLK